MGVGARLVLVDSGRMFALVVLAVEAGVAVLHAFVGLFVFVAFGLVYAHTHGTPRARE